MGSSSAILGRWIWRRISASRMMSTATIRSSEEASAPAPWLMLPAANDGSGNIAYRFHRLANKEELSYTNKLGGLLPLPVDINLINDVVCVGSSHGWLALYNRRNSELLLSNPVADRHIKLPPLHTLGGGAPDRVIVSEEEGEDGPLAFMTFGSRRRMALCSPGRSREWTIFGGHKFDHPAYDNLSYSRRHNRLLCITEEGDFSLRYRYQYQGYCLLESWVVDQHDRPPTVEWIYPHSEGTKIDFDPFRPARPDLLCECLQMRYIVCAHHSGDLFLVVRHVNLQAGPFGTIADKVLLSPLRGCHYITTPYKTIDFDVFQIYPDRREVKYTYNSLGGLAMFIGVNDSFAIPAAGVAGLNQDSLYFTDENRLVEPTRLERTTYGGHDNAIFDYKNKTFYPCCDLYPIEFDKIKKLLPLPHWFTPIN